MRDLNEININEGGRPVRRVAPLRQQVQEFEDRFGVTLPVDYISLLLGSNGGHPELDSFVPDGSSSNNRWAIDHFYHLDSGDSPSNLTIATSRWGEILGEGCVPFACDGGGNQIYLDMNGGGTVVLCIHDESFKRVPVAESFSKFIDKLEQDPDTI